MWGKAKQIVRDAAARRLRIQKAPDVDDFFARLKALGFAPRHVVDIGANEGNWTRAALRYFPDSQFTIVEPQASMRERMQDLLANPNVRLHSVGAGSSEGELPFTMHERHDSRNFRMTAEEAKARGFEQVRLPITTVDKIVSESGRLPPDMIKIDAEGHDLEVMKGATASLVNCEVLLVEAAVLQDTFANDLGTVIERTSKAGFRPFDITEMNRTLGTGSLWLMEVAFIRRGGALESRGFTYAS